MRRVFGHSLIRSYRSLIRLHCSFVCLHCSLVLIVLAKKFLSVSYRVQSLCGDASVTPTESASNPSSSTTESALLDASAQPSQEKDDDDDGPGARLEAASKITTDEIQKETKPWHGNKAIALDGQPLKSKSSNAKLQKKSR